MWRALLALACCITPLAAAAMVGGAGTPAPALAHAVVVIVGSRGNFCSGVALAPDLVLTAAHCVLPGADYKIVEYGARAPELRDVTQVRAHPSFALQTLLAHRATADVALLKLAAPLSSASPVALGGRDFAVAAGDAFTVAGAGVAVRGDGKSGGTVRAADLVATGQPGSLQIRLHDAATKGEKAGLGACTGDSGAPVFRLDAQRASVIGVVSWSTGPGNTAGCGGLTGVTPLSRYRDWITRTAKILGNQL
ncbi:MAG TPA: trypsin-like serine protease [Xanthobacteraceae bacterium]|nr:trypsin-like serine protease [Xanthobacteraceae bacterium]